MGISAERSRVITKYMVDVQKRGIPCDKDLGSQYAKELRKEALGRAEQLLGKDINFLQSESDIRLYLMDTFNKQDVLLFEEELGTIKVTLERAILFTIWASHVDRANGLEGAYLRKAEGLMWYIFAETVYKDIMDMRKLARGGVLYPDYQRNMTRFEWRRCLQIGRKYADPLLVEKGYTYYTLERYGASQMAYMLESGMNLELASKMVESTDKGLMCKWLPLELEDRLFKLIASGGIHPRFIDGYLAPTYNKDKVAFPPASSDYSASVYTEIVRPALLDTVAFMLEQFEEEASRNNVTVGTEVRVSNLSDRRVTFAVREDVDFVKAFPFLSQYCMKVQDVHPAVTVWNGYFF